MIEHNGDGYIVGLAEVSASGCAENESIVVSRDWPQTTGFAAAMESHGYTLTWPRRERVESIRGADADVVYRLDRLNPVYRRLTEARGELVLFARRNSPPTQAVAQVPQRFRGAGSATQNN